MSDYIRADGTLVLRTENTVDLSNAGTALTKFNEWCTAMGTPLSTNTSGLNGDDGVFCVTTQASLEYGGLTFVPRLMYGTEAGFGLYDAIPSSTSSASGSIPNVNRFYVTNSRPSLLFTYHLPGVDMGAFNTQYKIYADGFCLYAMHGHYGGSSSTFYVAIKVNTDGIFMYFEKGTTAATIPLYINLWNPAASTWTQSTLTTLFSTSNYACVSLENSSYVSEGSTIFGPISTTEVSKLNVVANIPADTSISYLYATDGATWNEMTLDSVLPASSTLYIRAILSTANPKTSPSITTVWLSKPEINNKVLLLKTGLQSRFNNVEGDITVSYDSSKGRLIGRGGAVPSFTKTFTPTGLFKKPNPSDFEKITLIPSIAGPTLTKVTYKKGYDSEKVTCTPSCTLVLTYVGTVNP